MDPQPRRPPESRTISNGEGPLASIHLTRFTIHPHRRSELVGAGASWADPAVGAAAGSAQRLLVELADGDWLEISITSPNLPPDDNSPYLDLAHGILGEEDGIVVAATPSLPATPKR